MEVSCCSSQLYKLFGVAVGSVLFPVIAALCVEDLEEDCTLMVLSDAFVT
jgi:hypothetical protein